jgi:hypothetical protein
VSKRFVERLTAKNATKSGRPRAIFNNFSAAVDSYNNLFAAQEVTEVADKNTTPAHQEDKQPKVITNTKEDKQPKRSPTKRVFPLTVSKDELALMYSPDRLKEYASLLKDVSGKQSSGLENGLNLKITKFSE